VPLCIFQGIVGQEFLPRGPEMVTRCPLVLQLINNPTEEFAVFEADHIHGKKEVSTGVTH